MAEIVLPFELKGEDNPKLERLLLFGKAGVGKTPIAASLPKCLHLSFDPRGVKFVKSQNLQITSWRELPEILKKIEDYRKEHKKHPYKYVVVDTATFLAELCKKHAEIIYSRAPMGSNWFLDAKKPNSGKNADYNYDILNLADGGGYTYLRQSMTEMLDVIYQMAPFVILFAHKKINRDIDDVNAKTLSLPGRIAEMVCQSMDAVGHLERISGSRVRVSFKVGDSLDSKNRIKRLNDTEFVLSEIKDGNLVVHWDQLFEGQEKSVIAL